MASKGKGKTKKGEEVEEVNPTAEARSEHIDSIAFRDTIDAAGAETQYLGGVAAPEGTGGGAKPSVAKKTGLNPFGRRLLTRLEGVGESVGSARRLLGKKAAKGPKAGAYTHPLLSST